MTTMDHSVELVTFLYSASLSMSAFFQNNLLLRKACNSSVPFGECTEGEAHAQHVVSIIYSWKASIQYTIPAVLIILAGPWSDSHGKLRKPLILLPIVGQMLTDSLCILNVYFWPWPPQIAALFEAITPGLFGARSMFWVGVISYISDNCSNEMRTLKYGIINAIYTISTLIGTGFAGFINVKLGFYGAFMISICVNCIAIFVGLYFVIERRVPYSKNVEWLKPKQFFRSYMSLFKRGTKIYTITLVVLLLTQSVLVGRIGGEYAVMYLFLRYKFQWYETKYSYYAAYKMVTIFFGTLFSVSVLSHRLKINDAIIGSIACTFDIMAAICYVFVTEPWQLCVGRVNAVQGLTTTLFSFVIVPLYTATYNFTFEYLTGAVFLLNVVLTFPLLIMFMIIYWKCKHFWVK